LKKGLFLAAFLGLFPPFQSAMAHDVVMHLYVVADEIEGEVGYAGGDMVPYARVDILDEDMNRIGAVATDDKGQFTFKPTKCITHTFRANLGAGHVIAKEVIKDDLPTSLAGCHAN